LETELLDGADVDAEVEHVADERAAEITGRGCSFASAQRG